MHAETNKVDAIERMCLVNGRLRYMCQLNKLFSAHVKSAYEPPGTNVAAVRGLDPAHKNDKCSP